MCLFFFVCSYLHEKTRTVMKIFTSLHATLINILYYYLKLFVKCVYIFYVVHFKCTLKLKHPSKFQANSLW